MSDSRYFFIVKIVVIITFFVASASALQPIMKVSFSCGNEKRYKEKVAHGLPEITYLADYKLILSYADGRTRLVDLESFLNDKTGPKSRQLQDRNYFKTVKVSELGETIEWPNGYDICPDLILRS